MKKFLLKSKLLLLNIFVILFLLILPYLLFKGKYYISGDDMRLYYIYPWEYFVEFTFSSWHHFSSVGANGPTQFMIPLLIVWTFIGNIIKSKLILGYLGFSAPISLGFLFFQLFLRELVSKKNRWEAFIGSLIFITSPILISNQYFIFLSTIWLIPLIPLLSLLYLKFLKTGKSLYLVVLCLASILMSLGLFSIPWLLGYIIPIAISGAITFRLFVKKKSYYFKKTIIFLSILVLSQAFWFFPFVMTYIGKSDVNFGSKVLSKEVIDTFSPTVLATATGNILYPILNLFHRQITIDFGWQLRNVFYSYFDKTLIINAIFPIILFLGLLHYKKAEKPIQKKYLLFFVAFVIALFLFTVNIGPLKEIFLLMGRIPGFVMFRNFYDKLGLSYIAIYSIVLTFSLIFIRNRYKKRYLIFYILVVLVALINFTRVGQIVNAPLWQTVSINRNIQIPKEYLDFMGDVNKNVPSTNSILTIPFGTALYSVIKDTDSDSVYTGTSPVKLFSGINDFSGYLSFYFSDAKGIIEKLMIEGRYPELLKIMHAYNINYIFLNKNVPLQVLNSWIFDKRMLDAQHDEFFKEIAKEKPLVVSSKGNYLLYESINRNLLIQSKNLTYQKINETEFRIHISKLKEKQDLILFDSYHNGWKLYPVKPSSNSWCKKNISLGSTTECAEKKILFDLRELELLFEKPIFSESHTAYSKYFNNKWVIDGDSIRKKLPKNMYKINPDGSIDVDLILYFQPQHYFYIGSLVSLCVTTVVTIYYLRNRKK